MLKVWQKTYYSIDRLRKGNIYIYKHIYSKHIYSYKYMHTIRILSFVGIETEMDSGTIVFKWDMRIKISFMQLKQML